MIPLLQTKTADTAHTGIFASETSPFSDFICMAAVLNFEDLLINLYFKPLVTMLRIHNQLAHPVST